MFGTVNGLRKDRAGMISSYKTYKLLFQCLQYYCVNRIALKKSVPMKVSSKSPAPMVKIPSKVTRKRTDDTKQRNKGLTAAKTQQEIQCRTACLIEIVINLLP